MGMDLIFGPETKKRKPVVKSKRDFIRNGQKCKCKNYSKCGSSLKRGGHLHHKNGNPSDNRYENLVLLCTKCHREITRKKMKEDAKERKRLPKW